MNTVRDISPEKASDIAVELGVYDRCIAFLQLIAYEDLLRLNFFNDDDKEILRDLQNKYKKTLYYNIYFVQKYDNDFIYIYNMYKPYDRLIFESQFSYTFDELLLVFEDASGETLTTEFLNDYNSGIFMQIINIYGEFSIAKPTIAFTSVINN